MHASDAKGYNFNFPTFKSAVCALVLIASLTKVPFDLVTDTILLQDTTC